MDLAGLVRADLAPVRLLRCVAGHEKITAGLGVERGPADPERAPEGWIVDLVTPVALGDDRSEMVHFPVHHRRHRHRRIGVAVDQPVGHPGLLGEPPDLGQGRAATFRLVRVDEADARHRRSAAAQQVFQRLRAAHEGDRRPVVHHPEAFPRPVAHLGRSARQGPQPFVF